MAPIRDSVSHSPNQTGLEHPGLDSQYETSPWSSGSPCSSDGNSNWSKVLVDGSADKPDNPSSTNSSVWPPSSSSFSCSSSSSSSGCGSGSDPELASECMDADSSSSVGSEKNLAAVTTAMMMSANASSSVSSTASSPSSSAVTSAMMVGVSVNGDSNGNGRQVIGGGMGTVGGANNGNNSNGSSHYSVAGSSSIGSNNHNKPVNNSGVWGSSVIATGGSTPCINGGLNPNTLNPNANHGAWPQNPTPSPVSQGQRAPQAQGMSSKLGLAPQQGPVLGWGGMAAPNSSSMMEDAEANNGTASSKVLGGSNSGNGGLQPTNLNTESNGPNNTMMMNTTTTTTNTTMTSSPPNSTASPQLSGDCSWASGGGNGVPLANGNPSSAPQTSQGEPGGPGAFGTPWGASTYPGDKGTPNADTVNPQNPVLTQAGNPQISSTAAYKSNNNHNSMLAPRWDQGPASNPNQPQSNLSWGIGSNPVPGSAGQTPGHGTQTTMGSPAGVPRPWGSSASSTSSSSSSSSASNNKTSNGEWGSGPPGNNHSDPGSHKGSSANNGWKSLEDDAMGMGGGGGGGSHALGSVTGGWGRTGGSEGSAESSGGRSSSDRDGSQPKGGNRRKVINPPSVVPAVPQTDVDPRVLSNTGWGQTPIRQNTTWDVNSSANRLQGPRGDDRKHSSSGWSMAAPAAPSQTSGGWGGGPGNSGPGGSGWGERPASGWDSKAPASGGGGQSSWNDGSSYRSSSSNTWSNNANKDDRSNTWTNAPKPQQGWGSNSGNGSDRWGNGGDGARAGGKSHWGEPPKGAGSVSCSSDRSGSGCWNEQSRPNNNTNTNTSSSSSNTWVGSGGSNAPDQSTPNPGSNWGDPAHKPNPQSNNQSWGEPMKNNHGAQNWGEPSPKPSNEWGKGPEANASRGNQAPSKPTGWQGGPIPTGAAKEEVTTGWEEPSPESVRRRMEIDDGTAAWGEPGKRCGGAAVNTRTRSSQSDQDSVGPPTQHQSHPARNSMPPQPQQQQPQPMQPHAQDKSSTWGESFPQKESSTWEPAPAPPVKVDNGTSAWGKPMDTSSSWEDPSRESRDPGPGWGGQHKPAPGPKPMETWGGEEASMGNSWDQEEEVEIGMWSNNQQDNRSHDQNTWNYKHKCSNKMNKPVNKQDEPWMKPFINQFNSMNFSRDSPDDSMKAGMVQDKRMDIGGMGDFNGVMGKNPGPRHQLHKESAMDRSPYYEKLCVSPSAYNNPAPDELSSNQSMSFSPSHSAPPVPCLDSGPPAGGARQNVNPMMGGNSVAQGRGGPQSQVPPQPNLRNQVPPPILPSQVPPSLLKYPGGTGGLNPLFGPQQVAVLNQLSQLNQFNQLSQLNQISQLQRLLFQQQQQKAQSQRVMPVGRPTEQQRPIGSSPSMMQPPRHLDPSLLKQAPPHKPYLDNYMSHNAPEMQKDAASLGSYNNFPLSLNSNLNVPLDMGGVGGGGPGGYKEPQSRLKKLWATDPLEQNSKPGAMSSGLRLEDSPFYDFLSPGPSPLSPPGQSMGSVGDGWPPRANSPPPHGNTVAWPPEFRPGEPWKGYPNIDPETDPYMTPGSVINSLSINTVRDTDHLRDRNNGPSSSLNTTMPSNSAWSSIRASSHSGSLTSTAQSTSARPSESKWSPGGGSVSNSSLAHELWKVPLPPKALSVAAPSRPPPGLTSQKPSSASSGWDGSALRLGGWASSESRYTPGSSWGDGSSSGRTKWLVLKNLTPQIDGSTLRTLCMQHGPLITFHLNLPHGNAVVCYNSKDEAAKAQKSLHMCVLGNTTILAEFASEEEINRFFAQGQSLATPSSGWQAIGSSQSRMDQSHSFPSRAPEPNQWNSSDLHSSSLWGGPNYSSSLWGNPSGTEAGRLSSPSPISSFLPVDHLTGGGDSM